MSCGLVRVASWAGSGDYAGVKIKGCSFTAAGTAALRVDAQSMRLATWGTNYLHQMICRGRRACALCWARACGKAEMGMNSIGHMIYQAK
jgi:hypothetical protein